MVLYYVALILWIFSSFVDKSDGRRGNYNNIQIASGSPLAFPNLPESWQNQEIPLEMILRMNEVTDTEKFIENFLYSELDNTTLSKISSEMRLETIARKSGIVKAEMAVCKPELKTVSIKLETDFTSYYHPSCVRVERCGGCCTHSLLTCTATDSEILNVRVMLTEYKGGERLVFREFKVIPVEKHTKCKCDCKIQPENCTKSQTYNKSKCSCECTNTDAEKKCNAEIKTKIWSKDLCACLCREEYECSTGYYFDIVSCRCELQEGRRKPPERPWIS